MIHDAELEGGRLVTRSDRSIHAAPNPDDPPGRAAFDDLYRSEWRAISAMGWTLTGSWSTAEELTQDAFADAFRRWDEIGGLDRPGAWVRRAVINRAASHHRHRGVEQRGLARWSSRIQTGDDTTTTDRTGDRATDAVGDPEFWAAVRDLPDRQRHCVVLHYLEDRSVAEIAEVLDSTESTVKVHLHRGRKALAERLSADAVPSGGDQNEEAR